MFWMLIDFNEFIAGWTGGICGILASHPLETMKVRQQTSGRSLIKTIHLTFRYDGIKGFYQGMLFPLLTIGPSNSMFFGMYANIVRILQQESHQSHEISPSNYTAVSTVFSAGCIAGGIQAYIMAPVEIVKTILQNNLKVKRKLGQDDIPSYTGTMHALQDILKRQGFRGFYRGMGATVLRDVPTSGIFTLTYEMMLYSTFSGWHTIHPVIKQFIAGGCAGTLSWVVAVPFDVLKSNIQTDNPSNPKYKGMSDCFTKLLKTHGYNVFFRGQLTTCLMGFTRNAAVFIGYEATIHFIEDTD